MSCSFCYHCFGALIHSRTGSGLLGQSAKVRHSELSICASLTAAGQGCQTVPFTSLANMCTPLRHVSSGSSENRYVPFTWRSRCSRDHGEVSGSLQASSHPQMGSSSAAKVRAGECHSRKEENNPLGLDPFFRRMILLAGT